MSLWIVLDVVQAFLIRPGSLLWLMVVIVGYTPFAAAYAITLINLRRHPDLVRPHLGYSK